MAQLSPWRRRHLETPRGVAAMAEPIDHAVRNLRVLVRRALAATRSGDRLPADVVDLLETTGRTYAEATALLPRQ